MSQYVIELDYLINDKLKPLGQQVGALSREIYLCDLALAGIKFTRLSDCELSISDRELTKMLLFHNDPDIHVTIVNTLWTH